MKNKKKRCIAATFARKPKNIPERIIFDTISQEEVEMVMSTIQAFCHIPKSRYNLSYVDVLEKNQ